MPGALVECEIIEKDGRYRVAKISRYDPYEALQEAGISDDHAHIEMQPARTKWFCKEDAYGFAVAFGNPGDIFIGHHVLAASGLSNLDQGEAISIAAEETDRGLVAIKIAPWQ